MCGEPCATSTTSSCSSELCPKFAVQSLLRVLLFFVENIVAIFLLSITESPVFELNDRTLLDLIFEEVSL